MSNEYIEVHEQALAKQREIEAEQARRVRAYEAVFTSEPGMLVLQDLKEACHFFSPTISTVGFPHGQVDPLRMAIAEGERNVILRILSILEKKEYYNG